MSALIKKPSNFKRKLVKENRNNSQFFSSLVPELNLEAEDNNNLVDSLGSYCDKVGLTKTSFQNYSSLLGDPLKFSNGSIIDLNKYQAGKYNWKTFFFIISKFTGEAELSEQVLRRKVEDMYLKNLYKTHVVIFDSLNEIPS